MNRDLRDPQKLGEALLVGEFRIAGRPLHDYYDGNAKMVFEQEIPDYDHGESLVQDTVRRYRSELVEAATKGDKHAKDTLRGIPNDEPSG